MSLCVRPRMIGCGAHSGLMGGCASVMFCVTARRMMCVQKDGLACGVAPGVLVRHVVRVYMLCHRRNQLPIGVRIRLLVGEGDRVRDQNSRARTHYSLCVIQHGLLCVKVCVK